MKRIAGISILMLLVCVVTTLINPLFVKDTNLYNVIRWTALYGIISIGVAFVIITGGIDLSIGSVVALTGCALALLLNVTFDETGQSFRVKAVDAEHKAVQLDGDASALGHMDKLQFTERGAVRGLLVDRKRDGETVSGRKLALGQADVVGVKENISSLTVGTELTVYAKKHMNVWLAILIVMGIAMGIGLIHGLLITKLNLQPFVVTLCGLLFYRGITRVMADDQTVGFESFHEDLKYLATGKPMSVPLPGINWISDGHWSSIKSKSVTDAEGVETFEQVVYKAGETMKDASGNPMLDEAGQAVTYAQDTPHYLDFWGWVDIPMPMMILVVLAIISAVFLNKTIYGRYLLALGRNEEAAQYSGINTNRMKVMSYVICSGLAGLGGILFVLDLNSVQPHTHGGYYELYAIAAAVLGGCSLRGGEGSILGVLVGAAVMRALRNSINLVGIPTQLEFAIIGAVILAGVVGDEVVKRMAARRRAIREAAMAEAEATSGGGEPPGSMPA